MQGFYVCGASASIAIAGSVRAKKEHPPVAISLVVIYAIVMILLLSFICRLLQLPAGDSCGHLLLEKIHQK
ncbi:putative sulfate exporter family transporter [Mucilaginibacter sp. UYCu711]|uniref:putative sulfate exporter family transporter n=1 Tax=Mucilaginibacter sp. UYCu711 TaxID=3156339 RepID=UPI003D1D5EF4